LLKPACGALALVLATAAFAATYVFKDPLDAPAMMLKRQITSTQMQAVAHAGERLVAVGIRGLVLVSDDGGKQWVQANVPVATDLTDVYFPTAKDGWAVGQEGVVLHTRDGGKTWDKQLDGRMTQKLLTEHFQSLVDSGHEEAKRYLQDTQLNYASGAEQVLLSVWFKDAQHGFVCGSFGTLLATDDGGVTWESWAENFESDIAPHFYAIRGTQKGVMVASEKGIVFRLDPDKNRFVAMQTGYTGTFFSLLETGDAVLAMGLRGNVYRLKGNSSQWEKLESGVSAAITASAALPDGGALLATQTAQLLVTQDGGDHFQKVKVERPMSFAGIAAAAPGTAVVAGSGGVRMIPLK
jgi:photosystem II stability/assembly factor-like uncharacterized protein